jgi:epsin
LNSQFTGMPQQNRMMPAATGPVNGFGGMGGGAGVNPYGSANPFGAQQPGQQQQQQGRQPGANNLIDL